MMAYENNNLNNAPFFDPMDPFEPNHIAEKLDNAGNPLIVGSLAAQLHPGLLRQNNYCNTQLQQQQGAPFAVPSIQSAVAHCQPGLNRAGQRLANMNAHAAQQMYSSSLVSSMTAQQNIDVMNTMSYVPDATTSFKMQPRQQHFNPMLGHNNNAFVNNTNAAKPFLGSYNAFPPAHGEKHLMLGGVPSSINVNMNLNSSNLSLGGGPANRPFNAFLGPANGKILPGLPHQRATSNVTSATASPTPSALPRSMSKSKRVLPVDYQPGEHSIICGNKRKYFESKGNIRFRSVCQMFVQEYVAAPTKIEKSAVVTKVMNILREESGSNCASFVSPQGGRWYAVSERTAREKVGTYFRDCLADSYKSSAKNKIARRKQTKKEQGNINSSNHSSTHRASTTSTTSGAAVFQEDDESLESVAFYDVVDEFTPVPL